MRKAIVKSKFILSLSLVLCMAVAIVGTSVFASAKGKSNKASYAEGDDIAFGTLDGHIINWTILSYDDSTKVALIVSRQTLASASITSYRQAIDSNYRSNGTKAGYVKWAESYWRGWLNKTFYEGSFTPEERAKIQKTTLSVENSKESLMNFYHDTTLDADYVKNQRKNSLNQNIYNSQVATSDYIFFLSTDEFTAHKDTIKYEQPIPYSWPLRTNSYDDPAFGLYVNEGTKLIEKRYYYTGTGIRPAMYIKLDKSDDEKKAEEEKNGQSGSNNSANNNGNNNGANNSANNNSNNGANNSNTNNNNANNNNSNNNTNSNTNNNANNANANGNNGTGNANGNNGTNNNNGGNNANANSANGQNANQNAGQVARTATAKKPTKTKSYANNGTQIGSIMLPYDSSYDMGNGATAQVAIDLDYLNFTDKQYTVTYKSSDANVFTVDSSGNITGVGRGTATLDVRMKKSNGKIYSMSCRIDVT